VGDQAGNPLDTSNASVWFPGSNVPDTLRPTIGLSGIQDSAVSIAWWTSLDLEMTAPVDRVSLAAGAVLLDSTRRTVEVKHRWLSPVNLRLSPVRELNNNAWYTLRVRMDSLVDLQGNRGRKDSVMSVRFRTRDVRTTGVIEGVLTGVWPAKDSTKVHVTARSLSAAESRTLILHAPGPFRMDRVVEGAYSMEVFRDLDRSGIFTAGRPYPFITSEPFLAGADTVKVRARWTVENVMVRSP
jgi:hypothetical protein